MIIRHVAISDTMLIVFSEISNEHDAQNLIKIVDALLSTHYDEAGVKEILEDQDYDMLLNHDGICNVTYLTRTGKILLTGVRREEIEKEEGA